DRGPAHRPRVYCLTEPAASPAVSFVWSGRNNSSVGSVIRAEAAITCPHSVVCSPKSAQSASGIVFISDQQSDLHVAVQEPQAREQDEDRVTRTIHGNVCPSITAPRSLS